MRYKFAHNRMPSKNAILLVFNDNGNVIGMVDNVDERKITLMGLDENGQIVIEKNANWIELKLTNLQSLRDAYNTYINKDVNQIIADAYRKFANEFIHL